MKKHLTAIVCVIIALIATFLMGLFFGRKLSSQPIQISAGISDGPAEITTAPAEDPTEEIVVEFPIDINTADIPQLMALPGIGEVLAQRIIDHRTANGPFATAEALMDVYGISEKRFEAIKDLITIGG